MLTWSTKLTVVVVVETAKPEQQWRWPNNLHIALFSISSYLCFIILSSQSGILLSPYRAKITAQSQRKKEQKLINKQHKPLMTCKLCPYQTNDQYRLRTHTEVVHQGVKRHKWVCQIFTSILSIIYFIISFISFQSLWARNTSQQLSRIIFGVLIPMIVIQGYSLSDNFLQREDKSCVAVLPLNFSDHILLSVVVFCMPTMQAVLWID